METKKTDRPERLKFWGFLVKELRLSRGLSQRELSRRTGVTRNTIRKIEDGATDPSLYSMEKILEAMEHELEVMDLTHGNPCTRNATS